MTAEEIFKLRETPVLDRLKDIVDNRDENYLTKEDHMTINHAILLIQEIDRRLDGIVDLIHD